MIDHGKYAAAVAGGLLGTRLIRIDADRPLAAQIKSAAAALRAGCLVAFPTETVYGLGANALDAEAIRHIFTAKGRPADNPLIVHIVDPADIADLAVAVSDDAGSLLAAFSPGPLTLILKKKQLVPATVTAGLDTVAIRIPAHPVARELIRQAGVPVAAPSANRSGRPSPTRAWHVKQDLWGRVSYILDGGSCAYGLESTVLDLSGEQPVILRPGSITAEQIRQVVGKVCLAADPVDDVKPENRSGTPRSPGLKYRHYAPRARLLVADAVDLGQRTEQIGQLIFRTQADNLKVGVICSQEILRPLLEKFSFLPLGGKVVYNNEQQVFSITYAEKSDAQAAGTVLFDALRRLDQAGVDVIIAEGMPADENSAAYMNRLAKAAQKE